MADTKVRVHTLAKDLGVSSKAIMEKCASEGIALKNHMHVLSAGLEATIREWFSTLNPTTAVEESSHVDLEKARVRRAPKKTKKAEAPTSAEETGTATATAEAPGPVARAPAPEVIAPAPPPPPTPASTPLVTPSAPPKPEAPAGAPPPARVGPSAPRVAAEAPKPSAEPGKKVTAAGPQNVPAPAQLQGPRLVRMERPDFLAAPRPAQRSTGSGGIMPPLPLGPSYAPTNREPVAGEEGESDRGPRRRGGSRHRANPRRASTEAPAVVGELLREWRDRDLIERRERLDHASGRGITEMRADETEKTVRGPMQRVPARREKIQITSPVALKEFSTVTGIAFPTIFRKLQDLGIVASLNMAVPDDTAQLIAMELGVEIEIVKPKSALDSLREAFATRLQPNLQPRPPIVTVLGHVDHGKTSLLDCIRKTNVAAGEAGGITQHVGAYRVKVGDRWVTFLDTPGHEAFTAMRARGAQMTDVVVLVVAADDGVMPQTIEAISHARAAKVPIVVALNKIDLPQADANKIYGQLAEQQLVPQEWGGDTDVIKTSAVRGDGVNDLLSHLAALTDLLDLKADPTVAAHGVVIEAHRSDRLGPVARVMVQDGTLKSGTTLVCAGTFGRVRAMQDDRGRKVREAGPATPVEVFGLGDVPEAGDSFFEIDDPAQAKQIAEEVAAERRAASLVRVAKPTTLEGLLAGAAEGEVPELNVILKTDVQGSVDVLKKTLGELPTTDVKLNLLHAAVGNVSESDVGLAQASQAIIIGFHVVPDPGIQRMAEERGVDIRLHKVIYHVTDEIKQALEGLLSPTEKVESRGRAEVREVFSISRVGKVAGCMVRDGVIARNHRVRIVRDGVPIRENAGLASLKRFKDDAREVRAGMECGLRVEGYDDVKPGDVIEAYEVTLVARKL